MTDMNAIVELIESANAVPSPDSLPDGALSSAELLTRIDERNTAMTDTTTRRPPSDPRPEPRDGWRRGRGPLIAIAAAMAIALVFAITTSFDTGNDRQPVADTSATTTPAPTSTTVATRAASALSADTPLLEVVRVFQARFDLGDVSGYEAIFDPASGYVSGSDAQASWFVAVTGLQHERDCELASDTQVRCLERVVSGLEPGAASDEYTTLWNGADGYISSVEVSDVAPTEFFDPTNGPGVAAYRDWLERINPDAFAELFIDGLTMKLDTEDARAGHRQFVPFFLTSTGPRAEQALPADTPLLDVVATFQERFDTGDVAGYEAIFHPMSGYVSGQDAETSWFGAVTGMQHERDCTVVGETQVRCVERAVSGLEPGTISDQFVTLWNGADGYIWSIDFPDGAPVEFNDPSSGPGVAAYRDWVEANAPDQFADMFVDGLRMKLDTEVVREAHRNLVAQYVTAIGG